MGIVAAIAQFFGALGSWFGFQSKQQDRFNAPDVVASKDAGRDLAEKEKIQTAVEKSDKAGKVSDEERKLYAED